MEQTFVSQICLYAVTTMIAPIIGWMCNKIGERAVLLVFGLLNVVAYVLLIMTGYFQDEQIQSTWYVSLCTGLIGLMNSAMRIVPFIYVGKFAPISQKGLYAGIFNSFIILG